MSDGNRERAVACEWCGRAIERAGDRWRAVKGEERGYDPLACDASDDSQHHPDLCKDPYCGDHQITTVKFGQEVHESAGEAVRRAAWDGQYDALITLIEQYENEHPKGAKCFADAVLEIDGQKHRVVLNAE